MSLPASAAKFDPSRAHEYAEQSRIALAGYDACHELTACMLASVMGTADARMLVAGASASHGDAKRRAWYPQLICMMPTSKSLRPRAISDCTTR